MEPRPAGAHSARGLGALCGQAGFSPNRHQVTATRPLPRPSLAHASPARLDSTFPLLRCAGNHWISCCHVLAPGRCVWRRREAPCSRTRTRAKESRHRRDDARRQGPLPRCCPSPPWSLGVCVYIGTWVHSWCAGSGTGTRGSSGMYPQVPRRRMTSETIAGGYKWSAAAARPRARVSSSVSAKLSSNPTTLLLFVRATNWPRPPLLFLVILLFCRPVPVPGEPPLLLPSKLPPRRGAPYW